MSIQLILVLACLQLSSDSPAGSWSTDFGPLELVQRNGVLSGSYRGGTLSGGQKRGRHWHFQYQERGGSGMARFRVEGQRLLGGWRKTADDAWQEWNGRRITVGIEGTWSTNFGPLKIIRSDAGWEGLYGDGWLREGSRQGTEWHFRYEEGDTRGYARFEVDADTLTGFWRAAPEDTWKSWKGTRVASQEQPLLIILEAPWEASFDERPYAFASMLKSHFQLTDQVSVRSMEVHDSEDIERACRAVALLNAPVYLLISSHGTPRGLTMNGADIPASAFGDLKYCPNLKLLHLAGCSMLKGDHYEEIRGVAGDHFPISGYKIDVPWTASALSDYFYLTQIFVHGVTPSEAIQRTHKLIPYSHNTSVLPEYPAMGLSIR